LHASLNEDGCDDDLSDAVCIVCFTGLNGDCRGSDAGEHGNLYSMEFDAFVLGGGGDDDAGGESLALFEPSRLCGLPGEKGRLLSGSRFGVCSRASGLELCGIDAQRRRARDSVQCDVEIGVSGVRLGGALISGERDIRVAQRYDRDSFFAECGGEPACESESEILFSVIWGELCTGIGASVGRVEDDGKGAGGVLGLEEESYGKDECQFVEAAGQEHRDECRLQGFGNESISNG
jgi:hypothetical protein